MKASRVLPSFLLILLASAVTAHAQSFQRGVEVAGTATMARLADDGPISAGFGGRLTLDLSRWVAIDGEFSFFPKDDLHQRFADLSPVAGLVYRRDRIEGLAGIKGGYRADRFGVFAKARPGFSRRIDKGVDCDGDVCALILVMAPEYKTEFAFDLGGVVEFYPTRRIVARFDLGDLMIKQGEDVPRSSTHNLTSRLGIGFRF